MRTTTVADFLLAALLLAGFLTPVAGSLCCLARSLEAIFWFPPSSPGDLSRLFTLLILLFISAAVVLLGPGAYSVDARLFGRREIIIPRRGPAPSQSSAK
jgi:uncharacterized membrane protein YphA (DoxX/SURF4 family)